MNLDLRVRLACFDWLARQVDAHGDVLPRSLLERGFRFDDQQVRLVGPQGIFKPQLLRDIPLSITTAPKGPYDDHFGPTGLRYAYRGTDPQHHDNVGLRKAMVARVPLVYFHGILPGKYLAAWPVFVVADDPSNLTFTVALDDIRHASEGLATAISGGSVADSGADARRTYITTTLRKRLHQSAFRERVLRAYCKKGTDLFF